MIIFALHSDNSDYQQLLTQLHEFATIETFEDMEFLLETIGEEDCHGIILDYDNDRKLRDKEIKKVKKLKSKQPLVLFSNTLDSKKLIKHQKSKFGAALYLQTPIDQEILIMLIEPFWQGEEMHVGKAVAEVRLAPADQKIVDTHESNSKGEISEESLETSSKMDGVFSSVFPDEYNESTGHAPSFLEESSHVESISFDDELEMGTAAEIELNLDESEEDLESKLPKEDDLTFPELDLSEMNLDGLEDEEDDLGESLSDDFSLESNIEDDDSLSLNLDEGDQEAQDQDFDLNLDSDDTGDELFLDSGEDREEVQDQGFELSLDSEDDDELLLESGEENEDFDLNLESGDDELSLDSDEEDEALDISFGSDNEVSKEQSELSSEDLPPDLSIDLAHSDELDSFTLSDDNIDDLEGEINLSIESNDLIDSADDLDDELTRPALDLELLSAVAENSAEHTRTSVDQNFDLEETDFEIESENTIMGMSLDESLSGQVDEEDENENDEALSIGEDDLDPESELSSDLSEIDEDKTDFFETPDLSASDKGSTDVERVSHVGAETKTSIHQQAPSSNIASDHKAYVQSHDDELVRLGETINTLRSDRESLLEKISYLEEKEQEEKRDFIGLRAQLDEKQIELTVVRKRLEKQVEELKTQVDLSMDKRGFLEKKNQNLTLEIEKMNKEHRMDYNRVHQRERELEEKLEMLRKDSEIQLRNRDQKILELKRKIDSLEFDIESIQNSELTSKTQQVDLEDKMDSVIKTLRNAIGQLEDDHQAQNKRLTLKKNLKR